VIILLPMSFNDAMVFELFPSKPGIDQYVRLFSSGAWLDVFGRSLQIAVAVMVLATALGTLAALGIVQLSKRLRRLVEAAFLMPQIVPSIVTAVAAYFVFSALGLIGTLTAVVIAHVVVALPFVVVLIRSRLETLDPDLTLASASLGAGPVKTFLLIVAPQILVSIAAAALLAFHVSFDEVVLALFLTGVRTKTLPVKLWDSILFEISPILPAISTLVIMLPVVMLVVLYAIRKWTGREQHR
jgi:ABC-type spermidine/putrescine transport system permease subunit II